MGSTVLMSWNIVLNCIQHNDNLLVKLFEYCVISHIFMAKTIKHKISCKWLSIGDGNVTSVTFLKKQSFAFSKN